MKISDLIFKTTVILLWAFAVSVAFGAPLNIKNKSAEKDHKVALAVSKDADASVKWVDIKTDLEQVGTALDAIDLGSITNTVFTGDQRTAVKNLKDCISSLKVATKNLMQATNKMVKKQKETERIRSQN